MYNDNAPIVTLEDIAHAQAIVEGSQYAIRTPMMHCVQRHFGIDDSVQLHLKLENLQVTGSFKVRGIIQQMATLSTEGADGRQVVTMSAGNYGKAFAFLASGLGVRGLVVMPETAPHNRAELIRSYGLEVERVPNAAIQRTVERCESERHMTYLHPFDDVRLIAGYASIGLEILAEVSDPDVVLVCCGGGGVLSGVAAAIKLSTKHPCRIYGVEPEGARTMHESFRTGRPAALEVSTVAAGLAPPFAGSNTFRHCQQFVDDILLVSDAEIVSAMFHLYDRRLLVEPSGGAAFAALLHGKVPEVSGRKVVVVVTGGNVTPDELVQLSRAFPGKT